MTDVSLMDAALGYARIGLSVIPVHSIKNGKCTCGSAKCGKPGKHPRGSWKQYETKPMTEEEIRSIWSRHPETNIGIVTGALSGVSVLDIDGEEGLNSLREAGIDLEDMPETPLSLTGRGGYHLVFRHPDDFGLKTKAGVLPCVDIRAEGGMFVAPPSLHASGKTYEWAEGRSMHDLSPADFDWSTVVAEASGKPKEAERSTRKWFEAALTGTVEGSRNEMATRLAGRYLGMGMTQSEARFFLRAWNATNDPPLPAPELDVVLKSIAARESSGETTHQQDILDTISGVLKVHLNSVKRISGDEPQYVLEFDDGTCSVSTAQLLSPAHFQQAVCEATKIVIRKLGPKTTPTHDQLAQFIVSASEDVDAGIEATGEGELILMVKDYLSGQRSLPEAKPDSIPLRGAFKMNGLIWISLLDLVQKTAPKWGGRQSVKVMAQRMRGLGMHRDTFTNEGTSRVMWGVDPKTISWEGDNDDE